METIGDDLTVMRRQPLAETHVDAIRAIAKERRYEAGEMVAEVGSRMDRFVYVLAGEIEVVDVHSGERAVESTLGPTQFMGDLGFLGRGSWTLGMRACAPTRTLEVERTAMLELMARVPELSDHILTVYAARRRRQLEEGNSSIKIVGADRDARVQQVASFLSRNRIAFQSFDMTGDDAETARLCDISQHQPSVVFDKDRVLDDPSPASDGAGARPRSRAGT